MAAGQGKPDKDAKSDGKPGGPAATARPSGPSPFTPRGSRRSRRPNRSRPQSRTPMEFRRRTKPDARAATAGGWRDRRKRARNRPRVSCRPRGRRAWPRRPQTHRQAAAEQARQAGRRNAQGTCQRATRAMPPKPIAARKSPLLPRRQRKTSLPAKPSRTRASSRRTKASPRRPSPRLPSPTPPRSSPRKRPLRKSPLARPRACGPIRCRRSHRSAGGSSGGVSGAIRACDRFVDAIREACFSGCTAAPPAAHSAASEPAAAPAPIPGARCSGSGAARAHLAKLQQHGLFHGGVTAFLVDNATTIARRRRAGRRRSRRNIIEFVVARDWRAADLPGARDQPGRQVAVVPPTSFA